MSGEAYVGDGDGLARVAQVLQHVLDQNRALGDGAVCPVLAAPVREPELHTNNHIDIVRAGQGNLGRHGCNVVDGI